MSGLTNVHPKTTQWSECRSLPALLKTNGANKAGIHNKLRSTRNFFYQLATTNDYFLHYCNICDWLYCTCCTGDRTMSVKCLKKIYGHLLDTQRHMRGHLGQGFPNFFWQAILLNIKYCKCVNKVNLVHIAHSQMLVKFATLF